MTEFLNTSDWWEWQERQLQDWLLDQKINGVLASSSHADDDAFLDDLNAELMEIDWGD